MGYVLLLALSLTPAAWGAVREPRLTEDLAHPPKLTQCMKELLPGLNVRRFLGPFRALDGNGAELRNVARYFVDTVAEDGQRDRWHWDLETRDARGWRFFSYETTMGTAIGMYASRLESSSRVLHPSTHAERIVSVEACARNLGQGTLPDLP